MTDKPIEIGILFFPGMTQLDVTAPFEVFARLPNARVHLLWKRIEPIVSDVGLSVMATCAASSSRSRPPATGRARPMGRPSVGGWETSSSSSS